MIFYGRVEQGKVRFYAPHDRAVFIASLEGQEFQENLTKKTEKRTDQQNKYYWGVVVEVLGNHFGYDSEEMHEALKFEFLKKEGVLTTVRSTTKLSTAEFADYIDRIIRWAASEYGCYIPDARFEEEYHG